MKTAAIGDTLLLAGLIEDVRRAYPAAAVILITGRDNQGVAGLLPGGVDDHLVVSTGAPLSAVAAVRRAALDIIVDFGSWPRFDALLTALSGARFRVGFRTAEQFRHYSLDRSVEHSNGLHERENYARLLGAIGVESLAPPRIDPPCALSAERYPAPPYAVFHAWSGGYMHEAKEWPESRWAELGRMAARRGWTVVLSGAGSDERKTEALKQSLRAAGVSAVNAAGAYTLAELADVFAASEVVVSVNTGVMHLSALVGARTVSLEGPTPTARWGPLGQRTRAVVTTLPGCGYLNLGFEYAGERSDCMDGISVHAVESAIEALTAIPSSPRRSSTPDDGNDPDQ
ncbi:MAG: glycosyl transferase family 9 [Gemmatimonadetes bacterium]|nr:glycosyl transferase family 9 [Gemmatimonadota bacterium]